MKTRWRIPMAVGLCIMLGLPLGVRADTPTPTAAPAPTATSTPSAQEVATFYGEAWIDAHVESGSVVAKIGGVDCGENVPIPVAPGTNGNFYGVRVLSEEYRRGCGREGSTITFFVNGRQARQTATWHVGGGGRLDLIVGPAFALYAGNVGRSRLPDDQTIVPYVGREQCGYSGFNNTRDGYSAIVFSNEQQAGCGVEGSQVIFKLLDAQGNVIAVANEKGVWHAWDGVSDPQRLALTFGPAGVITMPGTGTGDGCHGEGSAWALLGFVGLTSAALGFALRKQAMTR